MIRFWIGTALLAGSWLFGLDYFYPANPWAWTAAVAAGVLLLGASARPSATLHANLETLALLLLLPVACYAAWPYRVIPLLFAAALAIRLLRIHARWAEYLATGGLTAGAVLLVQSLALELYADQTSHSHDLPRPLPELLAMMASLLGIDAAATGSSVVMHSTRQPHRFGATWELLFDPATFLFFIGVATLLALHIMQNRAPAPSTPEESPQSVDDTVPQSAKGFWRVWGRGLLVLVLIAIAWLPLRAGLLMAIYLQRVLRSDPDRPLHAMNHCFSPWVLLALLVPPALLAWRFLRFGETGKKTQGEEGSEHAAGSQLPSVSLSAIAVLVALAVALFTAAVYWNPVGARREGRVMIVERHSVWEPTTVPYDTKSFGEPAGYNYWAIYQYLSQYYEMSRLLENEKIDDDTLARCDVLVIKNPTTRYDADEVAAVVRFVERGGGLLLVGDHTNVDKSGTILNDISRRLGFIFRDDLLFGFGKSPYEEHYVPPKVSHPIVQHVPPVDFAVSCSIDPGYGLGRSVIAETGLWSMGPEYHHENFHPYPQHCPEMRYGAFIQVWETHFGQGRVVAFTDSTIFSNFCVFQPGKAELMLGMIEWLNHGNPIVNPRPWLFLASLFAIAGIVWLMRRSARSQCPLGDWMVLLAVGLCAWMVASLAIAALHRWELPTPECKRPLTRVVIDRTTSDVPLSRGADTQGDGQGYGLLEQWIARTGCYTVRKEGDDAFSGDALVVICPSRSVTAEYREQLEEYVANGGRLLVIDSPENTGSKANSLLWPFGLSVHRDQAWKGKLGTNSRLPTLAIAGACEVVGGETIGRLDNRPVAAIAKYKKGLVMAIGFGSLWNDTGMGEIEGNPASGWMLEPEATVKERYDVLFALLGLFLEDKALPPLPPKKAPVELPMKESGPAEL